MNDVLSAFLLSPLEVVAVRVHDNCYQSESINQVKVENLVVADFYFIFLRSLRWSPVNRATVVLLSVTIYSAGMYVRQTVSDPYPDWLLQ